MRAKRVTTKQTSSAFKIEKFFGDSKGEQTKARLVSSAIKVLAEDGVSHLTFDSVGLPLKMKRAQVAYHYPDKTQLISEAIRVVFALGGDLVEAEIAKVSVAPLNHLRAYIRGTLCWIDKYPFVAPILSLALYLATIEPKYKKIATDVKMNGLGRVEKIVAGYCENQKLKTESVRELAWTLHNFIVGEVIFIMTCELQTPIEQEEERFFGLAKKILHEN